MAPGYPARFHPEYVRNGVANLFMMLQPLTGTCQATARHETVSEDDGGCRQCAKVGFEPVVVYPKNWTGSWQGGCDLIAERVSQAEALAASTGAV